MGAAMRGDDEICGSLFSYIDLEKRVRSDHPLRLIRQIANAALAALTETFEPLYSPIGRSSIPPERLMRALLLQVRGDYYGGRLTTTTMAGWVR
jgi:hypothetical protein